MGGCGRAVSGGEAPPQVLREIVVLYRGVVRVVEVVMLGGCGLAVSVGEAPAQIGRFAAVKPLVVLVGLGLREPGGVSSIQSPLFLYALPYPCRN